MRLFVVCCLAAFLADAAVSQLRAQQSAEVRVMTFNIRFDTAADGANAWPLRKELASEVIGKFDPHLLGLQEALRGQLDEILQRFPQYSSVGVGREADGGGEYSPLLFDRTRLDLLAAGTFWLSATPDVRGSHTWGNQLPRTCTWARFVDRSTNQELVVANTHWDHQSQEARFESGQLIAKRLLKFLPPQPVLLMGDFNAGPSNAARQVLVEAGLRDSFAELHPAEANIGTFHAFSGKANSEKIDAILINDRWSVLKADVIRTNRDGHYPSDHFPVTATLELTN